MLYYILNFTELNKLHFLTHTHTHTHTHIYDNSIPLSAYSSES